MVVYNSTMKNQKGQIYYSLIHFFYWMAQASLCSFCSAFLLGNGYSSSEIGLILALGSAGSILLEPVLADYADHSEKMTLPEILRIITGIYLLITGLLIVLSGKSIFLTVFYVLVNVVHSALVPVLNELNFYLEASGCEMNFGVARALGSLGYSVMSAVAGTIVELYGVRMVPILTMIVIAAVFILLCLYEVFFKKGTLKPKEKKQESTGGMIAFMKANPAFTIVSLGGLFLTFNTIITANYLLQILQNVGGDTSDMGLGLALAGAVEIPVMFLYHRYSRRFSSAAMLKASAIGYILKHVILLFSTNYAMVMFSQLFQMVSFALYLPASVAYAHDCIPAQDSVKGQALMHAMQTGAGLFASIAGGFVIDQLGIKALLILCVVMAGIGTVLVFLFADQGGKRKEALNG